MKFLLSWLREWVDTGQRTPQMIADDLESLGHEVESITAVGLHGIIVGEVIKVDAHPNADRLRVAIVNLGQRVSSIVCGAPNLAVGQKVPVALVGTRLPIGLTIEKRVIRGVESEGMICAEDELGLGTGHDGILVLDPASVPGSSFCPDRGETLFDIAITPNRGDVLSLSGLSRDLAALWRVKSGPVADFGNVPLIKDLSLIPVTVEAVRACPRYTARPIRSIQSPDLPTFILSRLSAAGHGRYHPAVDITNYVMEEIGVPLHAFDADKVQPPIVVRLARSGETIRLLDGQTCSLEPEMVVIADQAGPIALAGIMGGAASAVSDRTKNLILEAAYFDPAIIRRTRQRLKLQSDAAYRYERHIDPGALELASNRAAQLFNQYLDGQAGPISTTGALPAPRTVMFSAEQINQRLGTQLVDKEMIAILGRLGFGNVRGSVSVPSWRPDITVWEDLSEEIARLVGFTRLPRVSIPDRLPVEQVYDTAFHRREWLKDQFAAAGWTEHIGTTLLSPKEVELLGSPAAIHLANPISEEAAYLRPSLKLSLLKAIARNPIFTHLTYLEIGTVFPEGVETRHFACVWTGRKERAVFPAGYQLPTPAESIPQALLNDFKIRRPVWYWEGPIDQLLAEVLPEAAERAAPRGAPAAARMPSRYQPVLRDVALVVDADVNLSDIETALSQVQHVVDVELFDRYRGEKFPGKLSAAFHVMLEHPDRTLTTEEIQGTMKTIQVLLTTTYHAEIR